MGELISEVLCYFTYEKSSAFTLIILEVRHTSLTRRQMPPCMMPVSLMVNCLAVLVFFFIFVIKEQLL